MAKTTIQKNSQQYRATFPLYGFYIYLYNHTIFLYREFYVTKDYRMSYEDLFIGQVVAAIYEDNYYYRGKVVCFLDKQHIQVFYLDYGTTKILKVEQLRHLHLSFTELPVQAYRGRLYGIRPTNINGKWSLDAFKLFLDLVKMSKPLAAELIEKEFAPNCMNETETVFVLDLVDTSTEDDVHIANRLIKEGLAVADSKERADFPTTSDRYCLFRSNTTLLQSPSSFPSPFAVDKSPSYQDPVTGNHQKERARLLCPSNTYGSPSKYHNLNPRIS